MIEQYVKLGWYLLPVREKIPLLPGWQTQASNDPNKIAEWSERFRDCNWGVNAGLSGLVIVDIDTKNGATRSAFVDTFGPFDQTPETRTPSGGTHFYFKAPIDLTIPNSASKIMKGVDIRANGGQALIPPSQINELEYKWVVSPEDVPPQPIPFKLLEKLKETSEAKKTARVLPTRQNGEIWCPAGTGRWEVCQSLAGRFRNWGFSEDTIFEFLRIFRDNHVEYDESVNDFKLRGIAKWAGEKEPGKYLRQLIHKYRGKEIVLDSQQLTITLNGQSFTGTKKDISKLLFGDSDE